MQPGGRIDVSRCRLQRRRTAIGLQMLTSGSIRSQYCSFWISSGVATLSSSAASMSDLASRSLLTFCIGTLMCSASDGSPPMVKTVEGLNKPRSRTLGADASEPCFIWRLCFGRHCARGRQTVESEEPSNGAKRSKHWWDFVTRMQPRCRGGQSMDSAPKSILPEDGLCGVWGPGAGEVERTLCLGRRRHTR